ncbi:MAG: signal peptide peptidase SppA [Pirellulales bacterium]
MLLAIWIASLISSATGCVRFLSPLTVHGVGDLTAQVITQPPKLPVTPTTLPQDHPTRDTVAIIDVDGVLLDQNASGLGSRGENAVSLFRERLDAIEHDGRVRAVVVRINSPGGSVTATDIMWRDLHAFRRRTTLPVVACLMDTGTGGAYYLATAADMIIAHPTTVTGAIGCILNVYNLEDMMGQFNIVGVPIKAGKYIDVGSPIKTMDEDSRRMLQQMADEFHRRFKQVVVKSRSQVDARLETTFDGRVFSASQALELGLIDEIGYLDHAVAHARRLAGCPQASVIFFRRPDDPAGSRYSVTPNIPLQDKILPVNVPGLNRSRLPSFLYIWGVEPTAEPGSAP